MASVHAKKFQSKHHHKKNKGNREDKHRYLYSWRDRAAVLVFVLVGIIALHYAYTETTQLVKDVKYRRDVCQWLDTVKVGDSIPGWVRGTLARANAVQKEWQIADLRRESLNHWAYVVTRHGYIIIIAGREV